jgi:hypothetical protein
MTVLMILRKVETITEIAEMSTLTAMRPPTAIMPYTRIFRGRAIHWI